MRLSRWSRSAYDTDQDLALEAGALSGLVQVLPPQVDAEILTVGSKRPVDARLLDRAPSARLVITTTSGHEHLDLSSLRERGIRACRLPEARRDAVVESALAGLLDGLRQTGPLLAAGRQGRWARGDLPALGPRTLRGSLVGLVGLGVIGRAMAQVLTGLGARVVGTDPRGVPAGMGEMSVERMLATCDALSLHCDLNPSSQNIVGDHNLSGARPDLVLINTARGGLVDVGAVVQALQRGRLGGALLDVFPTEPWPELQAHAALPGLMLTPHSAGYHRGLPAAVRSGLVAAVDAFVHDRALPYALC